MNISETMASIRWMMEKHLGKYDNAPASPIWLSPVKEENRVQRAPVRLPFVLEALRRFEKGERIKDIAAALNSTQTTVGNIVKRRGCYEDLPKTEKEIIKYMKGKNRE